MTLCFSSKAGGQGLDLHHYTKQKDEFVQETETQLLDRKAADVLREAM